MASAVENYLPSFYALLQRDETKAGRRRGTSKLIINNFRRAYCQKLLPKITRKTRASVLLCTYGKVSTVLRKERSVAEKPGISQKFPEFILFDLYGSETMAHRGFI